MVFLFYNLNQRAFGRFQGWIKPFLGSNLLDALFNYGGKENANKVNGWND